MGVDVGVIVAVGEAVIVGEGVVVGIVVVGTTTSEVKALIQAAALTPSIISYMSLHSDSSSGLMKLTLGVKVAREE